MVRIASSKKTKPWENVHDVNIETKLYIMKLIHASSSFIMNFEIIKKPFQKASLTEASTSKSMEDEDAFVFL